MPAADVAAVDDARRLAMGAALDARVRTAFMFVVWIQSVFCAEHLWKRVGRDLMAQSHATRFRLSPLFSATRHKTS